MLRVAGYVKPWNPQPITRNMKLIIRNLKLENI